jgi:hypothetical protein
VVWDWLLGVGGRLWLWAGRGVEVGGSFLRVVYCR